MSKPSSRVVRSICVAALTSISAPAFGQVGPYYACGNIDSVTSLSSGLLVHLSGGLIPTNCVATPSNSMMYFIPQTYSAMVSVVLSRWLVGKTAFCLYTDPSSGSYCATNQAQPGG